MFSLFKAVFARLKALFVTDAALDVEDNPLPLNERKRTVDPGEARKRTVPFDARHRDAPVEIVEAGALRRDRDLGCFAAAVFPRHAVVASGGEEAHPFTLPLVGRVAPPAQGGGRHGGRQTPLRFADRPSPQGRG